VDGNVNTHTFSMCRFCICYFTIMHFLNCHVPLQSPDTVYKLRIPLSCRHLSCTTNLHLQQTCLDTTIETFRRPAIHDMRLGNALTMKSIAL
jgi:hypothetical protein